MDSPPKRITRARAAAKVTEPAGNTKKIVTAATKARTATVPSAPTFSASTKSTAAKRKARDDGDEDEMERQSMAKRPRGRPPQKEGEEGDEKLSSSVRASTASSAARIIKPKPSITKSARAVTATAASRVTRGRPRQAATATQEKTAPVPTSAPVPAAKSNRARSSTLTKTTANKTAPVAKPAVKKIVKFQEPDKENVEPAQAPARESAPAGLRGRPARRGGAAAARSTRPAANTTTNETMEKKPLSPKKVKQLQLTRGEESEDELAIEKECVKPMMKSPIKPPSKRQEIEIEPETTIAVNTAMFNPPEVNNAILCSPIRRPTSPLRDTMKSPAKRMGPVALPGSALKPLTAEANSQAPFKTASLLQSAAKRPQSPIKGLCPASAQKPQGAESASKPSRLQSPAKRAMPSMKPLVEHQTLEAPGESPTSRSGAPAKQTPGTGRPSEKLTMEDGDVDEEDEEVFVGPIAGLRFSARLSALLPRHADSDLREVENADEDEEEVQLVQEALEEIEEAMREQTVEEDDDETVDEEEEEEDDDDDEEEEGSVVTFDKNEDLMVVDDIAAEMTNCVEPTPTLSSQPENAMYQLREKDLEPCMDSISDSEDDTLPIAQLTATPTMTAQKTPKSVAIDRSVSRRSRRSTLGFTSLSEQLGGWSANSPVKATRSTRKQKTRPVILAEADVEEMEVPIQDSFENQQSVVGETMITDDDIALAEEAREMSITDPDEFEEATPTRQSFDDSLSDASQEYGDENQAPPEHTFRSVALPAPVTPARPVMRSFNTTTKVPLKPADDSSTSPLKKHSFTAPRAVPKRGNSPSKGYSGDSRSPAKDRRRSSRKSLSTLSEVDSLPCTPCRTDAWSVAGTPARTPRKDIDPSLLRGAIVFVDVHTSEGADASGIFVELLTQMGARCVKSWNWNPSSSSDETPSNKIGITHVVFKDGSKRTLEKVREANGVVQCVGVSWVLDCERENEWLDETPFCIDTSNIPRGGARRRKSMEPKALANKNGTLVSSPSKSGRRQSSPALSLPNRRQSSLWMHTPSDMGDLHEEDEEDDIEWSKLMLTPVPKTPAPEAVRRFAVETPSDAEDDDEDEDMMSPTKESMLTRTCPSKAQKFKEMGVGILNKTNDDQVLMRLMAARRKSLQFAPKVGSPLAKMWR